MRTLPKLKPAVRSCCLQCNAKQITGLADLLRFGIASSGNARGSYVAAAWLLNVARHHLLPMHSAYQRPDGSGFPHCDADWLQKHSAQFQTKANATPREALMAAMASVAATPHLAKLETFTADALAARVAAHLRRREPSLLVLGHKGAERFALLLAINEQNDLLFCCEIEESRARLKWFSALELVEQAQKPGAVLECISLSRQHDADSKKRAQPQHEAHVLYLDSDVGCQLLPGAEGLAIVAYAALHGQGQRDLSSCNVASLCSVALPKGQRTKVAQAAASAVGVAEEQRGDVQTTLRTLATHQLKTQKGSDFSFRGLGVHELCELAATAGLKAEPHVLFEDAGKNEQAINAFRRVARTALGRTIVNFWRPHLEQAGGGHHAVLVAYHPKEDRFLIDDPAAFKMPCYWVDTRTLVAAMATFDDTPGIDSFRGYLVVHSGVGSPTPWDTEYSASVVLRGGA